MLDKLNKQYRIRIDYSDYGVCFDVIIKIRDIIAAIFTMLLIGVFFSFRILTGA